MTFEISTNQFTIPRPGILAVCSGMHAKEPTARLDVAFKIILLCIVQHITRSIEEHHGRIFFQVILVKCVSILRGIHRKIMLTAKLEQRKFAHSNGAVPKSFGSRKHQYAWFLDLLGKAGIQAKSRGHK